MYAPPWARESARDSVTEAADTALEASEKFRSALPPAPQLTKRRSRWRDTPFEGDLAAVRLRERPTLDPVAVPAPPPGRGSSVGVLARVAGAVGLAALAAFFMVGTAPLSLAVKAEGDGAPASFWSRFVTPTGNRQQVALNTRPAAEESVAPATPTLAERFSTPPQPAETLPSRPVQTVAVQTAAVQPAAVQSPAVQPVAVPVAPQPAPVAPAPSLRALDRDEIANLYRRGEELVGQGDIAGGRLLLARAAEAGDARSALALGATYDAVMLGRLGVLGVAPDAAQARAWYAKAAEFGSGEASRRLEQLAQSSR
jgi:hypothetical protein